MENVIILDDSKLPSESGEVTKTNEERLPNGSPLNLRSNTSSPPEEESVALCQDATNPALPTSSANTATIAFHPIDSTQASLIGFLPTDSNGGLPTEFLGSLTHLSVDDDTPAAEALRANAEVHVNTAAKLARKIHVQTFRNIVKKATKQGMGNKRGKPPRIPPPRDSLGSGDIFVVEEEMEGSSDLGEDDQNIQELGPGVIVESDNQNIGAFDTLQQIPAEVRAATIETGKKCKTLLRYRERIRPIMVETLNFVCLLSFINPQYSRLPTLMTLFQINAGEDAGREEQIDKNANPMSRERYVQYALFSHSLFRSPH